MKRLLLLSCLLAGLFLCLPVHAQTFAPQTPQNSPAFVFAAPDTQSGIDPAETASTEAWEALGVTVAALLIFRSHSSGDSGVNTAAVTPVPEQNTGLTMGLLGALGYTGAAWSWRKKKHTRPNAK